MQVTFDTFKTQKDNLSSGASATWKPKVTFQVPKDVYKKIDPSLVMEMKFLTLKDGHKVIVHSDEDPGVAIMPWIECGGEDTICNITILFTPDEVITDALIYSNAFHMLNELGVSVDFGQGSVLYPNIISDSPKVYCLHTLQDDINLTVQLLNKKVDIEVNGSTDNKYPKYAVVRPVADKPKLFEIEYLEFGSVNGCAILKL